MKVLKRRVKGWESLTAAGKGCAASATATEPHLTTERLWEKDEMFLKVLTSLLLIAFSGFVFASSCPLYMGEIDEALKDPAVEQRLSEEELAEVRQLREEGEKAHQAGDHDKSMKALTRAKEILEVS